MLLNPQHFQLASRRADELVHYYASVLAPFYWGVVDFDPPSLADGNLTIARVEAVMPDGLVVNHPGSGESELRINVESHLASIREKPQTIFLTVAARRNGVRFDQRYKRIDQNVHDESNADDDLTVEVGVVHPKVQLNFADHLTDTAIGFPIARVEMHGSEVVLSKYEPPRLQVRSRSALHTVCSDVARLVRETATSLATSISHSSESTQGAQLLETRMLIHSLVSGLPALEALIDCDAAHPFPLYLSLASLAGNLAPGNVPARLPAYDHEDLLWIFESVRDTIRNIKRDAIHAPYELHAFVFRDDSFRLQIRSKWVRHKLMLGVRAPLDGPAQDVDKWVLESTIGEAGRLPTLRSYRSVGVKRERLGGDALPASSGVTFYELKEPYGDVADKELVIMNDNPGRPAEIVLYVNTES
jgi:type VI secretion system protein ImpJ